MAFTRWSSSSLSTLQQCGHKFYLKHIKKDYRQSGPKAKRGIAVHGVAKEAHKRQMVVRGIWDGDVPKIVEEPGTPKSIEEARDLAASEFESAMAKGVEYSKDEKEEGIEKVRAEAKDAAVDLSGFYVGDVAPPVIPNAVERKIEIQPKNMDITIMGYVDLIEEEDGDVIRDLKTTEKAPFDKAAELSSQLTMYTLLRYADVHKMPKKSRLIHLVRTPKKHDMKVVIQETDRDMEDVKILWRRIQKAIESVEKGVFVPADPASAGSPCGWCEFNDGTCEYVRKKGK